MGKLYIFLVGILLVEGIHGYAVNETRRSSKKGVSFSRGTFACGDFNVLNDMRWYYNWSPNGDMGCGGEEAGFIPMLWNFANGAPPLNHDTVLGFNEPNFGEQSNISPRQAAEYWIQIQNAYPDKVLVAPSPSPGGSNMGPTEWYDQFFAACNELGGCRVDYLATHSYSGCVDCDRGYLQDLCDRYNKKIWFTEFAVPNTVDVGVVFDYMGSMLYNLEQMDCVHRYSWFIAKWGTGEERIEIQAPGNGTEKWFLDKVNSLFVPGTSTLTPLGEFYNSFTP